MSSMTYRTSLSNTLYTYLVFGNLLWIEVDVLLGEEFVSDFGNIGFLLQVNTSKPVSKRNLYIFMDEVERNINIQ